MKNVLVVEPSFYGISFAQEAKKLGNRVIALVANHEDPTTYGYANFCDDTVLCDIRSPESILASIRSSPYADQVDALVPATDYVSAATAKVAETLGVFGVPYRAALLARNKDMARDAFKDRGVPSARYAVVSQLDQALIGAERIGYPVVMKPTNTASSQCVFFVADQAMLREAFATLKAFRTTYLGFPVREEYLVEEFMSGQEVSLEIFLHNAEIAFAEVTEKITTPLPYFVEQFHIFPTSVCVGDRAQIISVAKMALDAIGMTDGPCHVELRLTESGPRIVEVNGRPGGDNITSDLIKNAYGIDLFRETVLLYLGQPVRFDRTRDSACAVGYVLSTKDRRHVAIKGVERLKRANGVVRYDIPQLEYDSVNRARSSDDRLGYIVVSGSTPTIAKRRVQDLIQGITLE